MPIPPPKSVLCSVPPTARGWPALPLLHTKNFGCGTRSQFRCNSSQFEQPRQDHRYFAKIPQSCTSTHNPQSPPQTKHPFDCLVKPKVSTTNPGFAFPEVRTPQSAPGTSSKVLSLAPHLALQNSTHSGCLLAPSSPLDSSPNIIPQFVSLDSAYSPPELSTCLHKSLPKVCMSIAIPTLPDLLSSLEFHH